MFGIFANLLTSRRSSPAQATDNCLTISDNDSSPSKPRTEISHKAFVMLPNRLSLRSHAVDPEPGGADRATPAVLDAASLQKLRELDPRGENRLIERVVKAFDGSVSRLLSQLEDAHGRSDLIGIRHVAHTLKSSSASIGALKLSQICAEIETMVRQSQTEGLEERLVDMNLEILKVQAALRLLADNES